MKKFLTLAVILMFALPNIYANNKKVVYAVETNSKIKIDGKLDEQAWQKAAPATGFIQMEPSNGEKASQKTIVKVLYDNTGIYIGAIMLDKNPSEIRRDLTNRDEFGVADMFGVLIDPYNNGLYGYNFIVTAAGVQIDMKVSQNSNDDPSWDAVWESEVSITDSGWIAELKIPYSALRFSPENDKWGINFFRYIARDNELSSWNFIDKKIQGSLQQSGILEGIKDIEPPLRLAFMPYVSGYAINQNGKWGSLYRGGMDLKYGINESFTLDMMLIPDFGQVESDDQVLNLGPFETYYQEKRQFFTEGSELFNKGNIFYSRRIGATPIKYDDVYYNLNANETVISNPQQTQIVNATKITGRTDKGLGVGFLNAMTLPAEAVIEDTITGETRNYVTQNFTNYNVLVLDQALKNNSYVSFINTNLTAAAGELFSNASAVDYLVRIADNKFAVSGQSAVSYRLGSDIDTSAGFRNKIKVEKVKGNLQYGLSNEVISDKFDINDMGYMRKNDKIETNFFGSYNIYKPFWKFLNSYNFFDISYEQLYHTGQFTKFVLSFASGGTLKNFWSVRLNVNIRPYDEYDFYEPRVWDRFYRRPPGFHVGYHVATDRSKRLSAGTYGGIKRINEQIHSFYSGGSITLRVTPSVNFSWNTHYQDVYKYGFANYYDDNNVFFGYLHQTTIANTLITNLMFSNKAGLRLRMRHYWSKADYDDTFYLLNQDGTLTQTDAYQENHDINFNAFNIDLSFKWNFAPGSELSLVWKNEIYTYDTEVSRNFIDNLNQTIESPQTNSISLKILYYLDWNYLRRRSASDNFRS